VIKPDQSRSGSLALIFLTTQVGIISCLASLCCPAQTTLSVSPPAVVLTPARMEHFGLGLTPDGSMMKVLDDDEPLFFAANGGPRDGTSSGAIALVIRDESDLTADVPDRRPRGLTDYARLQPAFTNAGGDAVPSLRSGFLDPPPDPTVGGAFPAGTSFDRDYAGGGPVYADRVSSSLLMVYHGEYHSDYPAGSPFYTTLGLAISRDGGRSFAKLGPMIRPEIPPAVIRTMASSSGSLVVVGEFFYLYYSDMSADGTCDGVEPGNEISGVPCVTVARAKIADVVDAALRGKVAPWRKYYRGGFDEPGIGGRFSPLFVPTALHSWVRWPVVHHDAASNRYVMADVLVGPAASPTTLEWRESIDGIHWGGGIGLVIATAPEEINYPGLVLLDERASKSDDEALQGAVTAADGSPLSLMQHFAVFFVREFDLAHLGKPYTRDLEAVVVSIRRSP